MTRSPYLLLLSLLLSAPTRAQSPAPFSLDPRASAVQPPDDAARAREDVEPVVQAPCTPGKPVEGPEGFAGRCGVHGRLAAYEHRWTTPKGRVRHTLRLCHLPQGPGGQSNPTAGEVECSGPPDLSPATYRALRTAWQHEEAMRWADGVFTGLALGAPAADPKADG